MMSWDELSSFVLGKAATLDKTKNKADVIKQYN
jgi:hypothetical protein